MHKSVQPMGENGEKNDGEERVWEKICSPEGNPPLSGRERANQRRIEGEDCLSAASFAAPDDGAARNRLGPITAAALLGSFFSP